MVMEKYLKKNPTKKIKLIETDEKINISRLVFN